MIYDNLLKRIQSFLIISLIFYAYFHMHKIHFISFNIIIQSNEILILLFILFIILSSQ